MSASPGDVRDNSEAHRFELESDGALAIAEYSLDGNVITFTHTKVPENIEGHGIGSALARGALESVRQRGLQVVPRCRFIDAYVQRHPETLELLAP